jgi:hypothetical protein
MAVCQGGDDTSVRSNSLPFPSRYVLILFMTDVPSPASLPASLTANLPKADPPRDRPAAGIAPTQTGRVLGLVRRLIDFGRQLVSTLQNQPAPEALSGIILCFGTINLALIVARITRGLRLAAVLEDRLVRNPPGIDTPSSRPASLRTPVSLRTPAPRPPDSRVPRRRMPPRDDDAALLARLPSAEEIAEQVRHRAIGDIIADICRDLGITPNHALWPEFRDIIIRHGGNFARLVKDTIQRVCVISPIPRETACPPPAPMPEPIRPPGLLPPIGTGPPQRQAA